MAEYNSTGREDEQCISKDEIFELITNVFENVLQATEKGFSVKGKGFKPLTNNELKSGLELVIELLDGVQQGMEGTVVKNVNDLYCAKRRRSDVSTKIRERSNQKFKEFEDLRRNNNFSAMNRLKQNVEETQYEKSFFQFGDVSVSKEGNITLKDCYDNKKTNSKLINQTLGPTSLTVESIVITSLISGCSTKKIGVTSMEDAILTQKLKGTETINKHKPEAIERNQAIDVTMCLISGNDLTHYQILGSNNLMKKKLKLMTDPKALLSRLSPKIGVPATVVDDLVKSECSIYPDFHNLDKLFKDHLSKLIKLRVLSALWIFREDVANYMRAEAATCQGFKNVFKNSLNRLLMNHIDVLKEESHTDHSIHNCSEISLGEGITICSCAIKKHSLYNPLERSINVEKGASEETSWRHSLSLVICIDWLKHCSEDELTDAGLLVPKEICDKIKLGLKLNETDVYYRIKRVKGMLKKLESDKAPRMLKDFDMHIESMATSIGPASSMEHDLNELKDELLRQCKLTCPTNISDEEMGWFNITFDILQEFRLLEPFLPCFKMAREAIKTNQIDGRTQLIKFDILPGVICCLQVPARGGNTYNYTLFTKDDENKQYRQSNGSFHKTKIPPLLNGLSFLMIFSISSIKRICAKEPTAITPDFIRELMLNPGSEHHLKDLKGEIVNRIQSAAMIAQKVVIEKEDRKNLLKRIADFHDEVTPNDLPDKIAFTLFYTALIAVPALMVNNGSHNTTLQMVRFPFCSTMADVFDMTGIGKKLFSNPRQIECQLHNLFIYMSCLFAVSNRGEIHNDVVNSFFLKGLFIDPLTMLTVDGPLEFMNSIYGVHFYFRGLMTENNTAEVFKGFFEIPSKLNTDVCNHLKIFENCCLPKLYKNQEIPGAYLTRSKLCLKCQRSMDCYTREAQIPVYKFSSSKEKKAFMAESLKAGLMRDTISTYGDPYFQEMVGKISMEALNEKQKAVLDDPYRLKTIPRTDLMTSTSAVKSYAETFDPVAAIRMKAQKSAHSTLGRKSFQVGALSNDDLDEISKGIEEADPEVLQNIYQILKTVAKSFSDGPSSGKKEATLTLPFGELDFMCLNKNNGPLMMSVMGYFIKNQIAFGCADDVTSVKVETSDPQSLFHSLNQTQVIDQFVKEKASNLIDDQKAIAEQIQEIKNQNAKIKEFSKSCKATDLSTQRDLKRLSQLGDNPQILKKTVTDRHIKHHEKISALSSKERQHLVNDAKIEVEKFVNSNLPLIPPHSSGKEEVSKELGTVKDFITICLDKVETSEIKNKLSLLKETIGENFKSLSESTNMDSFFIPHSVSSDNDGIIFEMRKINKVGVYDKLFSSKCKEIFNNLNKVVTLQKKEEPSALKNDAIKSLIAESGVIIDNVLLEHSKELYDAYSRALVKCQQFPLSEMYPSASRVLDSSHIMYDLIEKVLGPELMLEESLSMMLMCYGSNLAESVKNASKVTVGDTMKSKETASLLTAEVYFDRGMSATLAIQLQQSLFVKPKKLANLMMIKTGIRSGHNSIYNLKSERKAFLMATDIVETQTSLLWDMVCLRLNDDNFRFRQKISPKAQFGAPRDLIVQDIETGEVMSLLEMFSKLFLAESSHDILTHAKKKGEILKRLRNDMEIRKSEKESKEPLTNLGIANSDESKWGPTHNTMAFLNTLKPWFKSNRDGLILLTSACIHNASKRIINSPSLVESVLGKLSLEGMNIKKTYDTIPYSIVNKKGEVQRSEEIKKLLSNSSDTSEMIVKQNILLGRTYLPSISHMGQGIFHATSTVHAEAYVLFNDMYREWMKSNKMPHSKCALNKDFEFHTDRSSDDSISSAKCPGIDTEEFKKTFNELYFIETAIQYQGNIRKSTKHLSSGSAIFAEVYSSFTTTHHMKPCIKQLSAILTRSVGATPMQTELQNINLAVSSLSEGASLSEILDYLTVFYTRESLIMPYQDRSTKFDSSFPIAFGGRPDYSLSSLLNDPMSAECSKIINSLKRVISSIENLSDTGVSDCSTDSKTPKLNLPPSTVDEEGLPRYDDPKKTTDSLIDLLCQSSPDNSATEEVCNPEIELCDALYCGLQPGQFESQERLTRRYAKSKDTGIYCNPVVVPQSRKQYTVFSETRSAVLDRHQPIEDELLSGFYRLLFDRQPAKDFESTTMKASQSVRNQDPNKQRSLNPINSIQQALHGRRGHYVDTGCLVEAPKIVLDSGNQLSSFSRSNQWTVVTKKETLQKLLPALKVKLNYYQSMKKDEPSIITTIRDREKSSIPNGKLNNSQLCRQIRPFSLFEDYAKTNFDFSVLACAFADSDLCSSLGVVINGFSLVKDIMAYKEICTMAIPILILFKVATQMVRKNSLPDGSLSIEDIINFMSPDCERQHREGKVGSIKFENWVNWQRMWETCKSLIELIFGMVKEQVGQLSNEKKWNRFEESPASGDRIKFDQFFQTTVSLIEHISNLVRTMGHKRTEVLMKEPTGNQDRPSIEDLVKNNTSNLIEYDVKELGASIIAKNPKTIKVSTEITEIESRISTLISLGCCVTDKSTLKVLEHIVTEISRGKTLASEHNIQLKSPYFNFNISENDLRSEPNLGLKAVRMNVNYQTSYTAVLLTTRYLNDYGEIAYYSTMIRVPNDQFGKVTCMTEGNFDQVKLHLKELAHASNQIFSKKTWTIKSLVNSMPLCSIVNDEIKREYLSMAVSIDKEGEVKQLQLGQRRDRNLNYHNIYLGSPDKASSSNIELPVSTHENLHFGGNSLIRTSTINYGSNVINVYEDQVGVITDVKETGVSTDVTRKKIYSNGPLNEKQINAVSKIANDLNFKPRKVRAAMRLNRVESKSAEDITKAADAYRALMKMEGNVSVAQNLKGLLFKEEQKKIAFELPTDFITTIECIVRSEMPEVNNTMFPHRIFSNTKLNREAILDHIKQLMPVNKMLDEFKTFVNCIFSCYKESKSEDKDHSTGLSFSNRALISADAKRGKLSVAISPLTSNLSEKIGILNNLTDTHNIDVKAREASGTDKKFIVLTTNSGASIPDLLWVYFLIKENLEQENKIDVFLNIWKVIVSAFLLKEDLIPEHLSSRTKVREEGEDLNELAKAIMNCNEQEELEDKVQAMLDYDF